MQHTRCSRPADRHWPCSSSMRDLLGKGLHQITHVARVAKQHDQHACWLCLRFEHACSDGTNGKVFWLRSFWLGIDCSLQCLANHCALPFLLLCSVVARLLQE